MIVLQSFLTGGQVVECDLVEPTRTLDPRPGEPLALTLRRTAQQRRPVGVRRPKVGDTSIVEGVRYWYRHDVAKTTSIHALARERDSRPDDETDRRTIQKRIHRAQAVLDQIGVGDLEHNAIIMLLFRPRRA